MDSAEPNADLVEQARIVPNGRRNQFDTRIGRIQTIGDGGIGPNPPHAIFDLPGKLVKFTRTPPYKRFFSGPPLRRPVVEIPLDRLGGATP